MKNVIFDLGGVILKGHASSILEKLDINDDEYNELIRFFKNSDELDLGIKNLEDKFKECNYSDDIVSKYKDILLKYYEYRDYNMDLINLINRLKGNDYNIFILSDNNKEAFISYIKDPLLKNIDGYVVSCDYGTIKSEGPLFKILIDKYNLNPSECYFIDDKKKNVDMANKYGIKGFIFNENDDINKLYSDMLNNGIKL